MQFASEESLNHCQFRVLLAVTVYQIECMSGSTAQEETELEL